MMEVTTLCKRPALAAVFTAITAATLISLAGPALTAEARGSEPYMAEYVVYINWDAFRRDYYDWANQPGESGTPNLNYLLGRGAYFANATNGYPSITNPMQTSVVTGSWPATHGNVYRYYDSSANLAGSSGRTNYAETIAEAVAASGLSTASVQQFMLQDRGTTASDPRHLYIQPGGRFELRVSEALRMLRGESVRNINGERVTMSEIPRFLAIYADDLDAAGHNGYGYGTTPSLTADGWMNKMVIELVRMDDALGTLIQGLRDLGIFERTAIVLTADHGMTPYWGKSSLPKLMAEFTAAGLKSELLSNGASAREDTDVVLITSGQAVQVYFRREMDSSRTASLVARISAQPYVGGVLNTDAMNAAGAHSLSGQMVVWPQPPNHFSSRDIFVGLAANHDTGHPSSHNVFMVLSGPGIKQGFVSNEAVQIIDAAPTMSLLLGVRPPANATGRVLWEALETQTMTPPCP